jgi:hypothetical protein
MTTPAFIVAATATSLASSLASRRFCKSIHIFARPTGGWLIRLEDGRRRQRVFKERRQTLQGEIKRGTPHRIAADIFITKRTCPSTTDFGRHKTEEG